MFYNYLQEGKSVSSGILTDITSTNCWLRAAAFSCLEKNEKKKLPNKWKFHLPRSVCLFWEESDSEEHLHDRRTITPPSTPSSLARKGEPGQKRLVVTSQSLLFSFSISIWLQEQKCGTNKNVKDAQFLTVIVHTSYTLDGKGSFMPEQKPFGKGSPKYCQDNTTGESVCSTVFGIELETPSD